MAAEGGEPRNPNTVEIVPGAIFFTPARPAATWTPEERAQRRLEELESFSAEQLTGEVVPAIQKQIERLEDSNRIMMETDSTDKDFIEACQENEAVIRKRKDEMRKRSGPSQLCASLAMEIVRVAL
eukprot:tig00001264_g7860.t1